MVLADPLNNTYTTLGTSLGLLFRLPNGVASPFLHFFDKQSSLYHEIVCSVFTFCSRHLNTSGVVDFNEMEKVEGCLAARAHNYI